MATVTYKRNRPPCECEVSDIKLINGKSSPCCDALFLYEPVVLDFGNTTAGVGHRNEILESNAEALHIHTQFQDIWLLGITEMELREEGKVAVKFETCVIN